MIATKIIFTDPTAEFASLLEAVIFFLVSNPDIDNYLMPHAVDTIVTNQWIVNSQTFDLINSHSLGITNYSTDAEKAQLFADSLSFWGNVLPSTSTVSIEQYPVTEIPAHATPILADDGNFYILSQENFGHI